MTLLFKNLYKSTLKLRQLQIQSIGASVALPLGLPDSAICSFVSHYIHEHRLYTNLSISALDMFQLMSSSFNSCPAR